MNKKSENKTIKLTVRVTKSEHNKIKSNAKHLHISQSRYLLKMLHSTNSGNKKQLRPINSTDTTNLLTELVDIAEDLDKARLDYVRAFDNLEHDNRLYNLGKLSTIPESTLTDTKSAVLASKKQLQSIEKSISQIEMTLYDN